MIALLVSLSKSAALSFQCHCIMYAASRQTPTDHGELDGRAASFKMEYQPDPNVQATDPWSEVYLVIIPSS